MAVDMKATVTERGQVTIPKALRKELGIKPGTVLEFKIKSGNLIAFKEDNYDSIDEAFGCLSKHINSDKAMLLLRGPR
jgi:antitoxin PrlF